MSVTVQHLNADATFLLSFRPSSTPGDEGKTRPFTILIDPWLSGSANIGPSWFAASRHTSPASISKLSDIAAPDIVIVSQKQPDHCHEETLRQLRPQDKTWIVAEAGAAKTILGYKHFNPSRVLKLRRYRAHKTSSVLRFAVPGNDPSRETAGEVTVSFIRPHGISLTAIHNAIGITYRPPTAVPTIDVNIPSADLEAPLSIQHHENSPLAERHLQQTSTPISTVYSESTFSPSTVTSTPTTHIPSIFTATSPKAQQHTTATPPHNEENSSFNKSHPRSNSESTIRESSNPKPRTLSILYTPHGISLQPNIDAYINTHLVPQSALPLTLLLHCFNRVDNPWILGGNIYTGAKDGTQLARALQAQNWISAHDEEKIDRGLATRMLRIKKTPLHEVSELVSSASATPSQTSSRSMSSVLSTVSSKQIPVKRISFRRRSVLQPGSSAITSTGTAESGGGGGGGAGPWKCAVRNLGPGEEMFLTA